MITLIKPDEKNYLILKYIFDQYKEEMDADDFKTVANNSNCMFFFDTDTESFIGCIYYYPRNDKLFVNVFATRKHHLLNLHIFKQTLKFYNCDIYAEILHKTSLYGALKCGFKKFKDNIYIYERK